MVYHHSALVPVRVDHLQRPNLLQATHELARLGKDVPPFHYTIAFAGGDTIRCAPYALFGSQELSNNVLHAQENRKACLMANQGMIAHGLDLDDAIAVANEVESLCEQYLRALQVGEPILLNENQMAEVIESFKGYGRWNGESQTTPQRD